MRIQFYNTRKFGKNNKNMTPTD